MYIQGSLLLPTYPIGYSVMLREDFLRRDMTSLKLMGLNAVRGLWGGLALAIWISSMSWGFSLCRNTTGAFR